MFSLYILMLIRIYSAYCSREMLSKHSWIIPSVYTSFTIEHISGFSLLLGLIYIYPGATRQCQGWPLFISLALSSFIWLSVHCASAIPAFFLVNALNVHSLLSLTQNLSKCSSLCLNALPSCTQKPHCFLNSQSSSRSHLITASSGQYLCLRDTVTHFIWCFPMNVNFSLSSQISIYIYLWLIGAWPLPPQTLCSMTIGSIELLFLLLCLPLYFGI